MIDGRYRTLGEPAPFVGVTRRPRRWPIFALGFVLGALAAAVAFLIGVLVAVGVS